MTTVIRGATAPIIAALLLMFALVLNTSTTQAQCANFNVTNHLACDLDLCLYSAAAVAPLCWSIPAGATVPIVLPPGFNPIGAVSAGGNRYAFPAVVIGGCTACFSQRVAAPPPCCGEVCIDRLACKIDIRVCTTIVCNP